MKLLPQTRNSELVVQSLGKELLVYNLKTHHAYSLNETSKIVFDYCDGKHSFDDLKRKYKFTDDLIHLALDELQKNNLLEDYRGSHFAGLSRREAIKKVGLASMITLPVISSLIAPTAATAASTSCIQNGNTSSATSTIDDSDATKCKASATAACCSRNSSGSTTTCDGCDIRTRICTSCICSVNCV